jgi:hypothetical protein
LVVQATHDTKPRPNRYPRGHLVIEGQLITLHLYERYMYC